MHPVTNGLYQCRTTAKLVARTRWWNDAGECSAVAQSQPHSTSYKPAQRQYTSGVTIVEPCPISDATPRARNEPTHRARSHQARPHEHATIRHPCKCSDKQAQRPQEAGFRQHNNVTGTLQGCGEQSPVDTARLRWPLAGRHNLHRPQPAPPPAPYQQVSASAVSPAAHEPGGAAVPALSVAAAAEEKGRWGCAAVSPEHPVPADALPAALLAAVATHIDVCPTLKGSAVAKA